MERKKSGEIKNFMRKHSHEIVAITCLVSGYIIGCIISHKAGYELGFKDGTIDMETILTGDYDDCITIKYF